MPTLKHRKTGVVLSCSEETAARLGTDWEPVEEKSAPAKKTTAKRASSKKSE